MMEEIWVVSPFFPHEGYGEPEAAFFSKEEADKCIEYLEKKEKGYFDAHLVMLKKAFHEASEV